jgi:hypothetical protein
MACIFNVFTPRNRLICGLAEAQNRIRYELLGDPEAITIGRHALVFHLRDSQASSINTESACAMLIECL